MDTHEPHGGPGFQPHGGAAPDIISMNPPPPPRPAHWWSLRPTAVAGVAALALAGGAGVTYAATHTGNTAATDTSVVATPTPSPSGRAGSGAMPAWRGLGGLPFRTGMGLGVLGGGVVHGQLTVPKSGGGYQTVDVQQGTVTAVTTTSITVKSADGYTASYAVTSKTVVDAEAAGIGSVKEGDTVFVTATVSGSTATAASITDMTAVQAGRASFGFRTAPAAPPYRPAS
jgi:hypothetical protein